LATNHTPIIIAGSGRSGTTWILDAIARANDLNTVFEPLQWLGVPAAKPFANRYIRNDAEEGELRSFMDQVFSGKLNTLWTKYRILPETLLWPKNGPLRRKTGILKSYYIQLFNNYIKFKKIKFEKAAVKFIRANLMLGWLSKNYGYKIIYIIRHPAAVIASKLRLSGRHWQHEQLLKLYLNDKQLMDDHLKNYKKLFNNSLNPITGQTLIWCIENSLPLKEAKKNDYCVVFYEDLILNSDNEWKRIIEAAQLANIPKSDYLRKPSQQARVIEGIKHKAYDKEHISNWMNAFTKQQLKDINYILDSFNMHIYNVFELMPNHNAFKKIKLES
jgi:hypothetical protein